MHYRVSSTVIN